VCAHKTLGVGSFVANSRRAVIGHRGSLLPRRFGTSESRGRQGGSHGWCRALVVLLPRAVGRQGPLGAPLEQSPVRPNVRKSQVQAWPPPSTFPMLFHTTLFHAPPPQWGDWI